MSWYAVHYVLKKSAHPLVKGVPKFLLLVIAYFVKKNHLMTPPLSLRQLQELLGVDESTIRRNRDLLCSPDVGELARHVRGKRDQFEMVKLAGELFVVDQRFDYACKSPGSSSRIRANRPDVGADVASPMWANRPDVRDIRANRPDLSPGVHIEEEDPSSSSEDAGGELTDQQREEKLAALRAAVAHETDRANCFCDWWKANYPLHNHGVLNTVRRCDRDAAFSLLCDGRTMERVQGMARVLWAVTGDSHWLSKSDRHFIVVESDRSIRVLLQKATVVEREVVRLGLDRPDYDKACEPVVDALAQHLERLRNRLGALAQTPVPGTPAPLEAAIARVAQVLPTIDVGQLNRESRLAVIEQLEALNAELLRAVREEVNDVMRTEAHAELAHFRNSMTSEAYQRAHEAAIDRLLRERYQLPVLTYGGAANVVSADRDESREARTA